MFVTVIIWVQNRFVIEYEEMQFVSVYLSQTSINSENHIHFVVHTNSFQFTTGVCEETF